MGLDDGRRRGLPLPVRVLGVLLVVAVLVSVPAWVPAAALPAPEPSAASGTATEPPGLDRGATDQSGASPVAAAGDTPVGTAGLAAPSPTSPTSERTPARGSGPWLWPLDPDPTVTRPFQGPAQPWLPGHRGADLAAAAGQEVRAPAAGRVSFAGVVVDRGVLTIDHPGGLRTSYEPVTPLVAVGEEVGAGQVVGVVAPTPGHCRPATCLHWGLRRDQTYLDPLTLLVRAAPPVLLPLRPVAA